MKIGYPCLNRSIGCTCSRTFRLRSYSEERLIATVDKNLECLLETLAYNVDHGLLNFRITSDLVPFAAHPVCTFDWISYFESTFKSLGMYIEQEGIRISMHPDQFTLLNSPDLNIFKRSVAELEYHEIILDLLGLDTTAKIQIHVGGVYDNKSESMSRFIERYELLPEGVRSRLVIENDERLYSVRDCVGISFYCGIPVVFDAFHHQLHNNGESIAAALKVCSNTWGDDDGLPMADYSSQQDGGRLGKHAKTIDMKDFNWFIEESKPFDFDLMLEIKDKEESAIKAAKAVSKDERYVGASE